MKKFKYLQLKKCSYKGCQNYIRQFTSRHIYCGSLKNKTGCSYKNNLDLIKALNKTPKYVERHRIYRLNNPDLFKKYKNDYLIRNKDKIKKRSKIFYDKNIRNNGPLRERVRELARINYRKKHPKK